MERSEGITATMIRIAKTMDRSNANLMRSIGYYEGSDSFVEAPPRLQPVARILAGSKPGPASAAVVQ
jgi:hypothetical protein